MATKEKLGQGKKECPHCKKIVGARSATCKHCGKTIAPKTKSVSNSKGEDIEKLALKFAFIEIGGLDKAIKAVEGYNEDGIGKFISQCGGKDKAAAQLRELESKK